MHITITTANELYDLGFSYRHYQKNPQKGMIYYYNDTEWVIGGCVDEALTDSDKAIIANGIWLPSEIHFIEWLHDNEFVFAIINQDNFFEIQCKDAITSTQYETKTPTLEFSLAAIVKKILKKKERAFDEKEKMFGVVE